MWAGRLCANCGADEDDMDARETGCQSNVDLTTTEGYTPEQQAAYCANYCIEGEHHPACSHHKPDERGAG